MAVETETAGRARRASPTPTEDGRLRRRSRACRHRPGASSPALLNAQNIYKSVYNQPEGTQREVALAFAGPLREVSMALRLDRPRAWFESAIGREHATIDTEIVLPTPPQRRRRRGRRPRRADLSRATRDPRRPSPPSRSGSSSRRGTECGFGSRATP